MRSSGDGFVSLCLSPRGCGRANRCSALPQILEQSRGLVRQRTYGCCNVGLSTRFQNGCLPSIFQQVHTRCMSQLTKCMFGGGHLIGLTLTHAYVVATLVPGRRLLEPRCDSRCFVGIPCCVTLASPSGACCRWCLQVLANVCEQAKAFTGGCKGGVGRAASTGGETASPSPPGDAEFLTCIVPWWAVFPHERPRSSWTQCDCGEFGITLRIFHSGGCRGGAGTRVGGQR